MNTFDELPIEWQRKVQELRAECAKFRIQRNQLRAELAELKSELGR